MIRVAIFGTQEQAQKVINLIHNHQDYLLAGIYSNPAGPGHPGNKSLPFRVYSNPDSLLEIADAVFFTDQVYYNYESIKKALKQSRHVFIFPEAKLSFFQLEELNKLAEEAGVALYLKHNSVRDELKKILHGQYKNPEFIHIYRHLDRQKILAGRSVFDSLYNEIIFALDVNRHNYRKFLTTTVPYCSPDPSLINVRLEFVNGTTANISLNSFTMKDERKTEIYAGDKLIIMDSESSGLKIYQKNPHKTSSYSVNLHPDQAESHDEEIVNFLDHLRKGNSFNDPFSSGLQPCLTASAIIHEIIPYPAGKTGSFRSY